jgi:hypothetical protein
MVQIGLSVVFILAAAAAILPIVALPLPYPTKRKELHLNEQNPSESSHPPKKPRLEGGNM